MTKLSELGVKIEELINQGLEPEQIAEHLEVPVSWVFVELDAELEHVEQQSYLHNPRVQFDW